MLSAEPGEDPWQQYTWLGVPMFINTVPTEELVQLLQEAGLSVVSTEFESQLEGGRRIEYAWIIGERLRSPGSLRSSGATCEACVIVLEIWRSPECRVTVMARRLCAAEGVVI